MFFGVGEALYAHLYRRIIDGARRHRPSNWSDMRELAALAQPYYHRFARGGEGHLEVGEEHLLHRPQESAHGAQPQAVRLHALVAVRRRAVGGDESLQGHDLPADRNVGRRRDQRAQPRADGARRGQGEGRSSNSSRRSSRPASGWTTSGRTSPSTASCGSPFYKVPHRKGVTGTAANFVLHVSDSGSAASARSMRTSGQPSRQGQPSAAQASGIAMPQLFVGMDVGSTTVKAVAVDPATRSA